MTERLTYEDTQVNLIAFILACQAALQGYYLDKAARMSCCPRHTRTR